MQRKTKVTMHKIIAHGKNIYLVNWSRLGRYGYKLIKGDTENEIYDLLPYIFYRSEQFSFIVSKLDRNNMPVVSAGVC